MPASKGPLKPSLRLLESRVTLVPALTEQNNKPCSGRLGCFSQSHIFFNLCILWVSGLLLNFFKGGQVGDRFHWVAQIDLGTHHVASPGWPQPMAVLCLSFRRAEITDVNYHAQY